MNIKVEQFEPHKKNEKLFQCVECPRKFDRQVSLASHHRNKHKTDETKPHKCTQCSKSFFQLENLEIHKGTHTKTKEISLLDEKQAEPKITLSEVSVLDEQDTKSKITYVEILDEEDAIPRNDYSPSLNSNLKQQLNLVCQKCQKKFNLKKDFDLHKKQIRCAAYVSIIPNNQFESRAHSCNQCDKSFSHEGNLKLHQMTHSIRKQADSQKSQQTIILNIFLCNVCQKSFSEKVQLRLHHKSHSEISKSLVEQYSSKENESKLDFVVKSEINLDENIDIDKKGDKNLDEIINSSINLKKEIEPVLSLTYEEINDNADENDETVETIPGVIIEKSDLVVDTKDFTQELATIEGTSNFRCSICSSVFKRKSNLKYHILSHTSKARPYECKFPGCDNNYKTPTNLWTHVTRMHKENSKFCPVCNKGFIDGRDLARHVRIHDESKFDHSRYLPNKMIGMLHQGTTFQFDGRKVRADCICDQCGKIFEAQKEKYRHKKYVHSKAYKCSIPYCAKSFKTEKSLKEHLKQNVCDTNEKTFQCDKCDACFSILDVLKDHSKKHIEKPHTCETCGNKFSTIDNLNVHLYTHTNLSAIPCNICNETFDRKYLLRKHKTNFHGIVAKKITCSVCEKMCLSNSELKNHMIKHTTTKNFKCNLCGKALKAEQNLKIHMRGHSGERQYQCDQCEASYFSTSAFRNHKMKKHRVGPEESFLCTYCGLSKNSKAKLNLHITLHTGEKRFNCSYCEKRFRNQGVRESHERVHKGVKNHICKFCSKAFREKYQMQVHTKRHTGERKHICPDCKKTFIEPGDVRKHMKVHHKNSQYKRLVKEEATE